MPVIACPFCGARGDLLEQWRESVCCACCGRSCLKADAERATRNCPRPGPVSPYRKSTGPPDVSRQAKAARVMKALFVDVPLSDAEKADDPDFGL